MCDRQVLDTTKKDPVSCPFVKAAPAARRSRIDTTTLYDARVRCGLTQERLARAVVAAAAASGQTISLSASAVSRWETGVFHPAVRYRPFIALALGVDLRELFPAAPAVPVLREPNGPLSTPREPRLRPGFRA